ncbi:HP1 family phage holin [Rodentibacter pneumotropicus]|uniref:Holin n=1 Tax=Rodentibacter pneumotropicus TaxID=758 RepID=A0A4S2PVT0_9PAST|nr:HP1 family phage holin [Rodentibacter pneumotropicus]THA08082.1 holin [Rodentibacter pneumotropicus]
MNNRMDGFQTFIGSIVALISSLTLNEWAAIFGILFGAISVWIAYRKYKEDVQARKEELAYKMLAAKIEAKKLGISINE